MYWGLWRIYSSSFWKVLFYFLFSQFPTIISTFFFLKFAIYLVISEKRFHFQCCKPQLVGLLPIKCLWTYWYGLLQSLITGDLGQRCKVQSFLPNFSTSSNTSTLQVQTIHKINRVLLILLYILVKTFVSNIILIYRTIWVSMHSLKCLKTVCSGLFTSTHCNQLVSQIAQIFAYPNNGHVF